MPISEIVGVDEKENKNDKIAARLEKMEERLSNLEQVLIKLLKEKKWKKT